MNKEEAPEIIYLYPYQAKDAEMQGANSDKLVEYVKREAINNQLYELEERYKRTVDTYYDFKDFADKEIDTMNKKDTFYLILAFFVIVSTIILNAFAEIPTWLEIAQCVLNTIFIVALFAVPYLIDKKRDTK